VSRYFSSKKFWVASANAAALQRSFDPFGNLSDKFLGKELHWKFVRSFDVTIFTVHKFLSNLFW
jgi:hypothetical protein